MQTHTDKFIEVVVEVAYNGSYCQTDLPARPGSMRAARAREPIVGTIYSLNFYLTTCYTDFAHGFPASFLNEVSLLR